MSKRRGTSPPLPELKRSHTDAGNVLRTRKKLNFDLSLTDELVLLIFSFLPPIDLCVIQPTNRHWARLSTDNQLWKRSYVREFERHRLRGQRGFGGRRDGKEVKPLPLSHAYHPGGEFVDWKWMFRISSNWRKGRNEVEQMTSFSTTARNSVSLSSPSYLLAGSLIIAATPQLEDDTSLTLFRRHHTPHNLTAPRRKKDTGSICALTLDQSRPVSGHGPTRLAAFYDSGDFTVFSVDSANPQKSRKLAAYSPRASTSRTTRIRQAVYHHPLLVTLSQSFHLSFYDLSGALDDRRDEAGIRHTQTLTSFTSFPPTSMVLTPGPRFYRLLLAYSAPVYPAHWGVAVTALTISHGSDQATASSSEPDFDKQRACNVLSSRTVRSFDLPLSSGWLDEQLSRQMREQWGRKVANVTDIRTDGKWLVLSADSSLQLYRLYLPTSSLFPAHSGGGFGVLDGLQTPGGARMTFVRMLHGHSSPVIASAVSDGRCVSLAQDRSIWIWDLEDGWKVEVQSATPSFAVPQSSPSDVSLQDEGGTGSRVHPPASISFDERQIVVADGFGVEIRRFDV